MKKTRIEIQIEEFIKTLSNRELSEVVEADMNGEIDFPALSNLHDNLVGLAVLNCYKELFKRS